MAKKSQVLEIIRQKSLAKSDLSDSQKKSKAIVGDLLDNNSTRDVDPDLNSAPKKSVLYKTVGMPKAPATPKSPAQPLKPQAMVPPGTQAAMNAGPAKTLTPSLPKPKVSMKKSKILSKLKLKKSNPDAKADEELAENIEALVENHEEANEDAEKKEMEKAELDLYVAKAQFLKDRGYDLAAFKLAEEVLTKADAASAVHKLALSVTTSIPRKDEYTPEEVAVAALAKTEMLAKSELNKAEKKKPYFVNNQGKKFETKEHLDAYLDEHEEDLHPIRQEFKAKPSVGVPSKSATPKPHEDKFHDDVPMGGGSGHKPKLGKAEHPAIKAYNAARQTEAEAKLKSPEGERARQEGNKARLDQAVKGAKQPDHDAAAFDKPKQTVADLIKEKESKKLKKSSILEKLKARKAK